MPGITRRNLIGGVAGAAVLLGVGGVARLAYGSTTLIRPPGGQDEERFLAACIKCDRCRSACPFDAISIASISDGLLNARTPKMTFRTGRYLRDTSRNPSNITSSSSTNSSSSSTSGRFAGTGRGFCNFCNLCIISCPTNALVAFDPNHEWIGEAVIDSERCIAFHLDGGCRKCADECPFEAITIDTHQRPIVDASRCNGCGVCENICPSNTYRTFQGSTRRGVNIEHTNNERPR